VVRCQCLKYIYIYLHIQRERGERCGALSVLEVYTYIYIYTAREIQQERERWRGERCGALAVLGRERERARHMHKPARQRPPQNPGCPDRLGLRRLCIHTCDILKGYRYTQLACRHTHVLCVVPFIKFSRSERERVHTCDICVQWGWSGPIDTHSWHVDTHMQEGLRHTCIP